MDIFTNLLNSLQNNPKLIIVGAVILLLVIAPNLGLLGALRASSTERERAAKWGKVFQGRALAQKAQDAQLNELHQLVSQLPPPPEKTPDE